MTSKPENTQKKSIRKVSKRKNLSIRETKRDLMKKMIVLLDEYCSFVYSYTHFIHIQKSYHKKKIELNVYLLDHVRVGFTLNLIYYYFMIVFFRI